MFYDSNIAACVNKYFDETDTEGKERSSLNDPIYKSYKAVLDSKSTDETLVIALCSLYNRNMIIIFPTYWHYYLLYSLGADGKEQKFWVEQALHASWEPRHSIHCYRFPWQQYVKLGAVLRHFGYTVVALHGCLQTEIQVFPFSLPISSISNILF